MLETLNNVRRVLSEDYAFVYLTSHTPGLTPVVLNNLLKKIKSKGNITSGEMLLSSTEFDAKDFSDTLSIPNGTWACLEN